MSNNNFRNNERPQVKLLKGSEVFIKTLEVSPSALKSILTKLGFPVNPDVIRDKCIEEIKGMHLGSANESDKVNMSLHICVDGTCVDVICVIQIEEVEETDVFNTSYFNITVESAR